MVSANINFVGSLANVEFEDIGKTYKEVAKEAMENIWSGLYNEHQSPYDPILKIDDFGARRLQFKVEIIETKNNCIDYKIEPFGRGVAWYNFTYWNWGIDVLRNVDVFIFQNNLYYIYERYRQLCAHEFGHLMGLGDAYGGEWQAEAERRTIEIPIPCIMRGDSQFVSSIDIEMILQAFIDNKLQIYDDKNSEQSKVIRQRPRT